MRVFTGRIIKLQKNGKGKNLLQCMRRILTFSENDLLTYVEVGDLVEMQMMGQRPVEIKRMGADQEEILNERWLKAGDPPREEDILYAD